MFIKPWGNQVEKLDSMAHPPHHLNSLHPCYDFTMKPSRPKSASLKFKNLVQAYISRQVSHVFRALSNAKSMLMDLANMKSTTTNGIYDIKLRRRRKKKLLRSIRMHVNWSSSHVMPMSELPGTAQGFDVNHVYYDSTWSSIISAEEGDEGMEPPLSGYLHWLEEKQPEPLGGDDDESEIDRLAEKFIASCHEKFRLEKQESYRRYQEMLLRSM